MPKIFGDQLDDIDITEEDQESPETQTELPDEVLADDVETPEEEPTNTEEEEPAGDEPAGEPSEGQEPDDSSLTEPQAQPSEDQPQDTEVAVSDEQIFTALSEKLGREVKSYDDLTPQETAQEDPFNGDEELKAIAEWKERTNRPVSDYYKFQKDYDNMEPLQAVRENLQLQYPDLTPEEIELEMEDFIVDEDIDTDTDAARKNLRLKKEAVSARKNLNEYKSTFDTPVEPKLSKEQQEAISFYGKYQEQVQKTQKQTEDYTAGIQTEASSIKSLPLQLDDEMSIDLNLSDDDRKSLPDLVTNMPHWYNEDGTHNHSAIVKDAVKIANFEKAVKLAFEQGVNKGIEQEDKDSRNVDFSGARKTNTSTDSDDIVIEGDEAFNRKGLTFGGMRNY